MADDLRARIENALTNTAAAFLRSEQDAPFTRHGVGHNYDGSCALCRGEVDTLLDAVMVIVEDRLDRVHNFHMGRCRWCGQLTEAAWRTSKKPRAHGRGCRLYVGPVEHRVVDVRDMVIGQSNVCACGTWWRNEEGGCPNAAETWRGPKSEEPL